MRTIGGDDLDFKALFEAVPGCHLILTPDLLIVAATDAYLASTLTQRDEILGRHVFDVFPDNPSDKDPSAKSNLRASMLRVVELGISDAMEVFKHDIPRPADQGGGFEERYWSVSNHPLLGANGKTRYIINHVEDVTEIMRGKKRLFEQKRMFLELQEKVEQTEMLQRAQKIESIGRLAGGIAHDFNNMLTVILGYATSLLDSLKPGDPHVEELSQIKAAGERAADLTKQLLAFSRQQVLQPQVMDLNAAAESVGRMLKRVIGEGINLELKLQPDLHKVLFDPGKLEQIVMNLALNARDAMPQGGKLTLETANVQLDEDYCKLHHEAQPGPHVMLAVTDAGQGMDPELQARIFEPFFTTKAKGQGTGLGLATVHGIVKQSGGNIWVYSEPGKGTCFKVFLPSTEQELKSEPAIASVAAKTNASILLVEDDDGVRSLLCLVLKRAGYKVLEASDEKQALAHLRNQASPIDLLLTDMILPDTQGPIIAAQAKKLRPGLKVAFMSGYSDHAVVHQGLMVEGTAFIEKPVTPTQLLEKIRGFLSA